MPAISAYPMNDPGLLSKAGLQELAARHTTIKRNWLYYDGKQKGPLKPRHGIDDNTKVNVVKRVVDSATSLLFQRGIGVEISESGDTVEELKIRSVLAENQGGIWLHNLAQNGAIAGHVFTKFVVEDDKSIQLSNLNPKLVSVFWEPDNIRKVVAYTITWGEQRQDLVPVDGQWLIRDLVREKVEIDPSTFAVAEIEYKWVVTAEEVWQHSVPPIIDWQNLPRANTYYGEPDITELPMQDALNFVASNVRRIVRNHAHPKTIGVGMQAADVQTTSVEEFWAIPSDKAKIFNLEMQSDLSSSLVYFETLLRMFYSVNRTVDVSTFKDQIGSVTNFGLRVLFGAALDKLYTKRELYENGLLRIFSGILAIHGFDPDTPITIHWPEPLPLDDTEIVGALETEIALGILSRQSACEKRGRKWETEQERIAAEQAAGTTLGAEILKSFEQGRRM